MKIRKRIKEYLLCFGRSPKEVRKEYDKEIKRIDDYARWRKSPYKIPGCPGVYACVAPVNHTKYQGR